MKNVLGIFRAACFSPGMIERDEAILCAVAQRLRDVGYDVTLVREEEFTADTPMPDVVFHMTRSPRALDILQGWQARGCRVVNSVEGIRGVERTALARRCAAQAISTPKTWIVQTAMMTTSDIAFPCWVKRTGTCAQEHDDVCRVDDADAYRQCLERFHARGIEEVVVMEHVEGRCVKFYAVQGTDFFHCLPAYDKWEGTSLSHPTLQDGDGAEVIKRSVIAQIERHPEGLPMIYGGDAIICDGTAYLIDLNDWPSFSACRDEAAEAIAQLFS